MVITKKSENKNIRVWQACRWFPLLTRTRRHQNTDQSHQKFSNLVLRRKFLGDVRFLCEQETGVVLLLNEPASDKLVTNQQKCCHSSCRKISTRKNTTSAYIGNLRQNSYSYSNPHRGGCGWIGCTKYFGSLDPRMHGLWITTGVVFKIWWRLKNSVQAVTFSLTG